MSGTTMHDAEKAIRDRDIRIVAEDGREIGVKVLPFRSRTHLAILDVDNHPWFFSKATLPPTRNAWIHDVADFTAADPDYHWDTPRYRELCIAGGLDPDYHRPAFAPCDREAGNALVEAVSRTSAKMSHGAMNVILDLIDLMRVDQWRAPVSAGGLKSRFASLVHARPADAEEALTVIRTAGAGSMSSSPLTGAGRGA